MTTTSTISIDTSPIHHHQRDSAEYDPLPDETVLKTGWLLKKGRRGVLILFNFGDNGLELEKTVVCSSIG